MTTINLIHDQQNGVIKLKVNDSLARSVWAYGEDTTKKTQYLNEARQEAFKECCLQTGTRISRKGNPES
jgi:hypothetical protein